MTQLFQSAYSMAVILGLGLPALADIKDLDEIPESALKLDIRVYNYANLPGGRLLHAQSEAARVLLQAGIETDWVECAVPGREAETHPVCKSEPDARDLQIRVLPRGMARKLMNHHSQFGLAFTAAAGGFGSHASIFYHRVEELSARRHTSRPLLLGHLIAHEIGHLLLGSNSHSRNGIMRAPWGRSQVERASLGTLLFTEAEAERMRSQVSERVVAERALFGARGPRAQSGVQ